MMLASLVRADSAIPSSSGQEALRLGLRAIKNNLSCPSSCTILAIDDENHIDRANNTLNLNTYKIASDSINNVYHTVDAAVFLVTMDNMANLDAVIAEAEKKAGCFTSTSPIT